MSQQNGKIIAPVNFLPDIGYVIGEDSGDIGTLCRSSYVNMWSPIKPLRINSPSIEINKDRLWQSAPDYKAGIKVSYVNSVADIISIYNKQHASCFSYDQPQDGDWFRALDFDGYNHYAINPFGVEMYCPSKVLVGQSFVMYMTERVVDNDSVQLEDMEISGRSLGDLYFGCHFLGPTTCVHTNSSKLITQSQEGYRMLNEEVTLSTTKVSGGLTPGSYIAYPLLSSTQFPGYTSMTGSFLNVPPVEPVQFTIVYDGYIDEGRSTAEIINNSQQVRVNVAGTVLQRESMEFSGRIFLCKPDGTVAVDPETVQFTAPGGDETNATTTFSGYHYLNGTDINQNWFVKYEFNYQGGGYTYVGRIRIV